MGVAAGLSTTGVKLSFTVTPEVALEIRAITAAELEAKRLEDEARSKRLTRGQLLTHALKQCKKAKPKHKRPCTTTRVRTSCGTSYNDIRFLTAARRNLR
jgi:hypothetical protein